jgi:hypothetical protein
MASFTAGASPERPRGRGAFGLTGSPENRSRSESTNQADAVPVVNHVVNQLAFSRLSSTPLSVIFQNLPADLKGASPSRLENKGLTKDDLRKLLNAAPCVGEIGREGKDAAGKPLESEYYYIPDEDPDAQRRAAVVDGLRKPSLRNCRKQHKVRKWVPSSILADLTLDSNTIGRSPEPHNENTMEKALALMIQLMLHWVPLVHDRDNRLSVLFPPRHTRMHLAKRRLNVFFLFILSAMHIIDGTVISRLSWKALYGSHIGSEKNIASELR